MNLGRHWFSLSVAVVISIFHPSSGCSAPPPIKAREAQEPPVRYSLTVGDKTLKLTEGQSVDLDGSFTNPKVTLRAEPTRTFSLHGITFDYPRGYTFEADLSEPAAKTWTLSGPSCVLMVFVMQEKLTAATFADALINRYGKQSCRITNPNAELNLGKHKCPGVAVKLNIAGQLLAQEIYLVESHGRETKLLVIQDSLGEQDKPTQERQMTVEIVAKSFELK